MPSKFTCTDCLLSNLPRAKHKLKHHYYAVGEALSSDAVGPMPTTGINGEQHIVTFIDACTRYAEAIPICSRTDIPTTIANTYESFRANYGSAPDLFVSDRAREYLSIAAKQVFAKFNCYHSPT